MNRKIVFNVTGKILCAISVLMVLPLIVTVVYKEWVTFNAFLISIGIGVVSGLVLQLLTRKHNKTIYAKEGFLIASMAWVSASLLGCLPFIISGEIPNFFDAFFETVSGFTTTGSSILRNVEECSHGVLFWRSFSHWVGGMGVLVFLLVFVSSISDRSIHILRAEMPGPVVGKLTPRSRDTTRILYIMYVILTLVEIILLWCGEMDLFESLVHSLGTAGTGGFSIKSDGVASYSPYSQWVITVFMLLFGINFNLYYLVIIGRFKTAIKSEELWTYLGIFLLSTVLITVNIFNIFSSLSDSVRHAAFQVASLVTTTGYSTYDFALWPEFSKAIIFVLLFTGACAGSTAGGLKLSRIILLIKMMSKEFKKMLHPRSISAITFEGKEIDRNVESSVKSYFAIYMFCIAATFLIISAEPFGLETNLTAAITCFNNVGPGFGAIGPSGSFADYSSFSKVVLSISMLLGRLEVFPLLIALTPSTWRKNS